MTRTALLSAIFFVAIFFVAICLVAIGFVLRSAVQ
jgi:hypothetical protein